MSGVTTLPFSPDGWTVDDLDELPDDGSSPRSTRPPLRFRVTDLLL